MKYAFLTGRLAEGGFTVEPDRLKMLLHKILG